MPSYAYEFLKFDPQFLWEIKPSSSVMINTQEGHLISFLGLKREAKTSKHPRDSKVVRS